MSDRERAMVVEWRRRWNRLRAAWATPPLTLPAAAAPAAPQAALRRSEMPLRPARAKGADGNVIIAAVWGLDRPTLEGIVTMLAGEAANGPLPVLLTDCELFELFRAHRLPFEYLPSPERQREFGPGRDWDVYILRRLALVRRKWQPSRIVAFGPVAKERLIAWRASPFEQPGIEQLIA